MWPVCGRKSPGAVRLQRLFPDALRSLGALEPAGSRRWVTALGTETWRGRSWARAKGEPQRQRENLGESGWFYLYVAWTKLEDRWIHCALKWCHWLEYLCFSPRVWSCPWIKWIPGAEPEFQKAAECQEMLTIHICQMNSSGELFTPCTPALKVKNCILFIWAWFLLPSLALNRNRLHQQTHWEEWRLPFGQVLCSMNAGDYVKPSLVEGVLQVFPLLLARARWRENGLQSWSYNAIRSPSLTLLCMYLPLRK